MKMKKTLLALVVLLLSAMAFAEHWTDDCTTGVWYEWDKTFYNYETGQWLYSSEYYDYVTSDFYIIKKDKKNLIVLIKGPRGGYQTNQQLVILIYTDEGNYSIEMTCSDIHDWDNVDICCSMLLSTAVATKNLPFSDFVEVMTIKAQEVMQSAIFDKWRGRGGYIPRNIDYNPLEPFTSDFNGRKVNGIQIVGY